ncbi:MAG: hypothetical protein V5B40_18105 [Candidatus Accumulibacter meliphilus]|uniref:hypothetical protein n=1 Tax=Candidatus Accumulibacter meliphilus TaxID=2211374 RepID=UPI002FC3B625
MNIAILLPHASHSTDLPEEVLCAVLPIYCGGKRFVNAVLPPAFFFVHRCKVNSHEIDSS